MKQARKSQEYLKRGAIYQLFLRPFTREGTLKSAEKMLPHIAETGFKIIYLCPVTLADEDPDQRFWSDRQKQCGLGNPRNPYRVKDYYAVDPEYGTDRDLKEFIGKAHRLGLRVILDIVYYHCGPCAVFLKDHPDFILRNPDGSAKNGEWHFPELNFKSAELREYLWRNMEYFLREFDADGYRCDVAASVPIDFWEEGRRRMEAIKPDCMMLAEANIPEHHLSAFDVSYGFSLHLYSILRGKSVREVLAWVDSIFEKYPAGSMILNATENHDTVNDSTENRNDAVNFESHTAALVCALTRTGVPLIYNGQEIGDASMHSIFGDRNHGKNLFIDWASAETPKGKARLALVKSLLFLRNTHPAFAENTMTTLKTEEPDDVFAFRRGGLVVVINFRSGLKTVTLKGMKVSETLLSGNTHTENTEKGIRIELLPFGWTILETV